MGPPSSEIQMRREYVHVATFHEELGVARCAGQGRARHWPGPARRFVRGAAIDADDLDQPEPREIDSDVSSLL